MNGKDYRIVISCRASDDFKLSMQLARWRDSAMYLSLLQHVGCGDNNVTKDHEPCFYGDVTATAQASTERVSACDAGILRCRLYYNTAYEQGGFCIILART